MPAGILYLYLINCLYNVFVSVSQRGTILPPRLTKGSLIFVFDWFISDQLSPFHRKTMPDLKRIQEIASDIAFFFNLAVVKKVTIFFNNVMYLDAAFLSPVGPYIRSIENRNKSVFPNSLVVYNLYRWDSDLLKFAPIMECFSIEYVSDITWDSVTSEIIIQINSFVKFCCRMSPFSCFILQ